MNLKEIKDELETYLLLNDIFLEEIEIEFIIGLMMDSNYIQILYTYSIEIIYVILELLESREMYEECAVIVKVIQNINKLEKTEYSTNYR